MVQGKDVSEVTCSNLFSPVKNYSPKTISSELKNNMCDGILLTREGSILKSVILNVAYSKGRLEMFLLISFSSFFFSLPDVYVGEKPITPSRPLGYGNQA